MANVINTIPARKLRAQWSQEMEEDLRAFYGGVKIIDITEAMDIIARKKKQC